MGRGHGHLVMSLQQGRSELWYLRELGVLSLAIVDVLRLEFTALQTLLVLVWYDPCIDHHQDHVAWRKQQTIMKITSGSRSPSPPTTPLGLGRVREHSPTARNSRRQGSCGRAERRPMNAPLPSPSTRHTRRVCHRQDRLSREPDAVTPNGPRASDDKSRPCP